MTSSIFFPRLDLLEYVAIFELKKIIQFIEIFLINKYKNYILNKIAACLVYYLHFFLGKLIKFFTVDDILI